MKRVVLCLSICSLIVSSCEKEELYPTDMSVNYVRANGQVATAHYERQDLSVMAKKINGEFVIMVYGKNDRLDFEVATLSSGVNGIYTIKDKNGLGDVALNYRYVGTAAGVTVETDRTSSKDTMEGVLIINNYNAEKQTATCSFNVNILNTQDPRLANAGSVVDKIDVLINGSAKTVRID